MEPDSKDQTYRCNHGSCFCVCFLDESMNSLHFALQKEHPRLGSQAKRETTQRATVKRSDVRFACVAPLPPPSLSPSPSPRAPVCNPRLSCPLPALPPEPSHATSVAGCIVPCPSCGADLRAFPHPHAPLLLSPCGHSLCGECVEAVACIPCPVCPVCAAPVADTHPNPALGALGEQLKADRAEEDDADAQGGEGPAPEPFTCPHHPGTPLTHMCGDDHSALCAHCITSTHAGHAAVPFAAAAPLLSSLSSQCDAGSAALSAALAGVARAREAMCARHALSVAAFRAECARARAALDAHEAAFVREAEAVRA